MVVFFILYIFYFKFIYNFFVGGGGGEGWKGKIPKGTGVGWGLDDGLEQKIRSSWDVPSSSINLNPNPKPNPKTTCI